jgi:hypothetical protein
MIVAKTTLGNNEILIEAVEASVQVAGEVSGRQTTPTGIEDNLKEAYGRVKDIIISMAEDFALSLKEKATSGQKVEMEFNLVPLQALILG